MHGVMTSSIDVGFFNVIRLKEDDVTDSFLGISDFSDSGIRGSAVLHNAIASSM